jgi:hypothetical protein
MVFSVNKTNRVLKLSYSYIRHLKRNRFCANLVSQLAVSSGCNCTPRVNGNKGATNEIIGQGLMQQTLLL